MRHASANIPRNVSVYSAAQYSPSAHLSPLQKFRDIAPYLLPDEPAATAPVIWHTDIHPGNFFVKNGRISGITNWHEVCARPLILRSSVPRVVQFYGEKIFELPPSFHELDADEQKALMSRMTDSILRDHYDKQTAKVNPASRVWNSEYRHVRCYPIWSLSDAWDEDILRFRESLLNIVR